MVPAIFVNVPTFNEHREVLGTQLVRYDQFVRRLLKGDVEDREAAHIAMGIAGEAGEFVDAVKKEYIYGHKRDLVHIIEELGDIEFYLQCAYNHYGLNRQNVLQQNAIKLSDRYRSLTFTPEESELRRDKKDA